MRLAYVLGRKSYGVRLSVAFYCTVPAISDDDDDLAKLPKLQPTSVSSTTVMDGLDQGGLASQVQMADAGGRWRDGMVKKMNERTNGPLEY